MGDYCKNMQEEEKNSKKTLYIGGLDETLDEKALHNVFNLFGDIKDIVVPRDVYSGKHRGFGFVEFEEIEDAKAAIDNVHNSELMGKILRVNYAQKPNIKGGMKGWSHQPVWAEFDTWLNIQNKMSKT